MTKNKKYDKDHPKTRLKNTPLKLKNKAIPTGSWPEAIGLNFLKG